MSFFDELMRCNVRSVILMIAVLCVTSCGGGGGGGAAAPVPPLIASSIQDALAYGVNRGLDGVWVYVDDANGSPTIVSAGVQNRSLSEPARPETLFKIASISKMFIAVSATKLVSDGTLRLDDTLVFWLPSIADRIDNAGVITIRNLLQHRSGVPDFDSQPGFSWEDPHVDNDVLLDYVLDKPADFSPDSQYQYSNTNYLLLGRIMDVALNYSHHDYVQNEILSPLGMVNTYSLLADTSPTLLAKGYWNDVDRTMQDYVAPGGSMISTAKETGIFLRALATGTLLSDNEQQIYASVFTGYGHSGWLPGYQSIARYHPATNTVVVQFVNTTGGGSEDVSAQVYDRVLTYLQNN